MIASTVRSRMSLLLLSLCICFASAYHQDYDYIVVGAGTAGSVVANRLSEDPHTTVLLLEAGGEQSLLGNVPLTPLQQLPGNKYDWGYLVQPQKHAFLGQQNNAPRWVTGRVLGGTSVLHFNLYVRGNYKDYDNWAAMGAKGWSWKDVLHYFIKSEDNTNDFLVANGYHGRGGEMRVSHSPFYTPMLKHYIGAVKELGYPLGDFNADRQDVFYPSQGTIKNGSRLSSYKAFVEPILCRKNLKVLSRAYVTKILFDEFKQAKAVSFIHGDYTKIASAKREIIISAGTVNSAKLLMLSGIGPKEHLSKLGIPVLSDLPVGKNFHDHIGRPMIFTIDKPYSLLQKTLTQLDYVKFLGLGQGRLTSLAGTELIGFIYSHLEKSEVPDIQIVLLANSLLSDGGLALSSPTGLRKEVFLAAFARYVHNHTVTCNPILLRPKSRGYVTLKSADPFDPPLIDPKYFSHPDDVLAIVQGMKACLPIANTRSLKLVGMRLLDSSFPSCDHYPIFSDKYLACIARVFAIPLYHGAGTCKMGSHTDPTTVVDERLRVKGVHGLRVVDCSIMPALVSGNPQAAAMMIGEKAADMLQQDDNLKSIHFF